MADTSSPRESWSVEQEDVGTRLDVFLTDRLALPRNRVQRWIRQNAVTVDGATAKASHRVEYGERVVLDRPAERDQEALEPEFEPIEILYEDDELAVLEKPAGLVVHPGAGWASGTLCHRLVARYPQVADVGHARRPGIVHRLDIGTSGLMVVALSHRAYHHLVELFATRAVDKNYLALCFGNAASRGRVEHPIGRHPTARTRMTSRADGKPALTEWQLLDCLQEVSVSALWVRLHTGRTHQVRVHLQARNHPLLGDPTYGGSRVKELRDRRWRDAIGRLERPALHAARLRFEHPDGRVVTFRSEAPRDLQTVWKALGGRELSLPREEEGDL